MQGAKLPTKKAMDTRDPRNSQPAPARRRGHRKPFEPTDKDRQIVVMLAGFGVPQSGIVQQIKNPENGEPIDIKTLRKHFAVELERGVHEANAKVAGSLFKNAVDNNNVAAQIFWLKTRARWSEAPQQIAFTDPEGNPVEPPSLSDFYKTVQSVTGGAPAAAPDEGSAEG